MSVEQDLQNAVIAINDLHTVVQTNLNTLTSATNTAVVSANSASNSAVQAANSAIQSANSATNAANSAIQSANSATNAANSATNADNSAIQSANSATNADNSAIQSANSATNAANSATQAANSATNAANSATQAANAAIQAANAAIQAANSATNAQSFVKLRRFNTISDLKAVTPTTDYTALVSGRYQGGDSVPQQYYGVISAPVATFTGTTVGTKPYGFGTIRTLTVTNVTNQIYIGMSLSWSGSPTPVTIIGFVSGVYGGAGVYRISVPTETTPNVTNVSMSARFADNNGSIIVPTGGDGTSVWLGSKTKVVPVSSASTSATEFRGTFGSVSVIDFGAKGDGVTDDSASIQAAINSSNTVEFPSGLIFRVTKTIFLPSNAYLWGGGEIFVDQTPKYLRCFFASPETSNITIDGLNFRGGSGFGMDTPSTAYQGICVGGYYVDNITVKNCAFFNFVGSGGTLVAFVTSNNIKILHNYFDDSNSGYSDMYLGYYVGDTIVDGNISYSNSDVFIGVADLYEDISSKIKFPNCSDHIITNNIHIKGRWNVPLLDVNYATFSGSVISGVLTIDPLTLVGTIVTGQTVTSKSLPDISFISGPGSLPNTWKILQLGNLPVPDVPIAESMQAATGATFTGKITNNILTMTNVQGYINKTYWISSAVGAALSQGAKVTTSTAIFTAAVGFELAVTNVSLVDVTFTASATITTPPTAGQIYSDGTNSYVVVSATSSQIVAKGSVAPAATGTLNKTSTGTGQPSVAYSSMVSTANVNGAIPAVGNTYSSGGNSYTVVYVSLVGTTGFVGLTGAVAPSSTLARSTDLASISFSQSTANRLFVTAMTGSLLANNTETILANIGGVTPGTTIVSQITPLNSGEALGGIGRYTISNNLGTISSRSMYVTNRWNMSSIPTYSEFSGSISGTTLTFLTTASPLLKNSTVEADMPLFGTGVSGATFTGNISGTTLNVPSAPTSGSIVVGQTIVHPSVIPGTVITGGPVSTGGSGTSWTVSISQNVTSTTMQSTTRLVSGNQVSPSQTVSATIMTCGFWQSETLNTPAMAMTAKFASVGREGIDAHYGYGRSHLICKGNIIGNVSRHGIYLRGSTGSNYDGVGPDIVSDNILIYCGSGQTYAPAYSSGIRVETTLPSIVTNNYLFRTGYFPNGSPGIQLAQDIECGRGANDLIISENSCIDSKNGAISMVMTVGPSYVNNVKIIGNTIRNSYHGIAMTSSPGTNYYYDAQILNNHITLTGADIGSIGNYRSAGVYSDIAAVQTKYSLRIDGNTIVGAGRDATFTGTISGNRLTATNITGEIKPGQRLAATTATFTGEQGNGFYQFTVSGITNLPVAGDYYTSGGQTYTIVSATATTIVATGTAALTATTAGTLTRSPGLPGSGDPTIAFSAFACQSGNILKVTSISTGTILANETEVVTTDGNIIISQITPLLAGEATGGIGRYRMASVQAYISASRSSISSNLSFVSPQARFGATCSGTTLTVTEMGSGVIVPNATASLAPEIYTDAVALPYDFTVSGVVNAPAVGNIYTIGNVSYTITSVSSGTIRATGMSSPPATGTLTRSTGSGDQTIAYSAVIGMRILSQNTPLITKEVLGGPGRYTVSMSLTANTEANYSITNIWNLSGSGTNIASGVSMTSSSQAYGLALSMDISQNFTGTSLISQNTMRGLWRGFASWRIVANGIQYTPHRRIGFETRLESNRFVSCTTGFYASGNSIGTLMILDYSNIFDNCATTGVGTTITWFTAVFGRSIGQNSSGQFLAEWTANSTPAAVEQYYIGDMVLNSAPAAGGSIGWVCTTSGTTGATWQRYGQMPLSGSATWDPPNLVANTAAPGVANTTVPVPGAALGDYVTGVSFDKDLQGLDINAWVSAANTVTVRLQNNTTANVDLASGTVRVNVMKQ